MNNESKFYSSKPKQSSIWVLVSENQNLGVSRLDIDSGLDLAAGSCRGSLIKDTKYGVAEDRFPRTRIDASVFLIKRYT